jgi:phosphate transport system substrate-binding protein
MSLLGCTLGYVQLDYAIQKDIPFGVVRNREGVAIWASLETVTAAGDGVLATIPEDLRFSLTDAPGKGSYPICGTTWAVIWAKQRSDHGPALVEFLRWATHEGQDHAKQLHYARLPKGLVERVDKKLDQVSVGN